jgi:hypothetical protein
VFVKEYSDTVAFPLLRTVVSFARMKTDKDLKDKKNKEAADKVKGNAGQVKDLGKKSADDLKAFGK